MDELTDKLSGLLSDPESLEKFKSLASSFIGGGLSEDKQPEEKKHEADSSSANTSMPFDTLSPAMLLKIKHIMEQMNKTDDPKTRLLLALKPYMSSKRVVSIEQAMKFMQMAQVFNMFGGDFFKSEV